MNVFRNKLVKIDHPADLIFFMYSYNKRRAPLVTKREELDAT